MIYDLVVDFLLRRRLTVGNIKYGKNQIIQSNPLVDDSASTVPITTIGVVFLKA
jgi:hypothetical protein